MRKMSDVETRALEWLAFNEPANTGGMPFATSVFNSLVKKKRVEVEATDDGPAYSLSLEGRRYIAEQMLD